MYGTVETARNNKVWWILATWMAWVAGVVGVTGLRAQGFEDAFGSRQEVTGLKGEVLGTNVWATIEEDEPRHGGKAPGKSMWITWVAPVTGLATLEVEGQDFDVLLGVYRVKAGQAATLKNLERVARNDDGRSPTSAEVEFGTKAGERYEIAVDGFARSSGAFLMKWEVEELEGEVPTIVAATPDQAFLPGSRVVLSYAVEEYDDDDVKLHWFLNGQELQDEEGPTLVIPSLGEAQVGHYSVRVDTDEVRFFTETVEVQISTEGAATTLARNKPEDAMDSPLDGLGPGRVTGRNAAPAGDGVTRGYNGSQVFDTTFAGRDPAEPVHCGLGTGSSYWFAYQAPASGVAMVDTAGSTFDTVLAAYTYDMPYVGYAGLREVGCDDNSGPDGRSSVVSFRVTPTRYYVVVVDGVNGARGRARLNYRLETNSEPVVVVPRLVQVPASRVVEAGTPVVLEALAEGSEPLAYRWVPPVGEAVSGTNGVLDLGPVGLGSGGWYRVEVSNRGGSVTSGPVGVTVWTAPGVVADGLPGRVRVRYGVAGPWVGGLEMATGPGGPWTNWMPGVAGVDGLVELELVPELPTAFLRLRFPEGSNAASLNLK